MAALAPLTGAAHGRALGGAPCVRRAASQGAPRRGGGLGLPREAAALAPLLLQRERIERLVATLIELLDQLEDTDVDGCEAEDLAPPRWSGGPGDPEDAEPELVPLTLGRVVAAASRAEARR